MGMPLSRVLRDFSAPAVSPPPEAGPVTAVSPSPPVEDALAARLREAYANGEEAGKSAARAETDRELAELGASAEADRAQERRLWAAEQGEELATRLTSAIETLEKRIADQVARVLTPFVTAELRDKMVRELSESVGKLLAGGGDARLRIIGPVDLLSSLRDRLGASHAAIDWEPCDQVDVTLVAGDSRIESEIGSWIERFAEANR